MAKENCEYYETQYAAIIRRQRQLDREGALALSRYDIWVAHGGDQQAALKTANDLIGNQLRYFGEKVAVCRKQPRQITLWTALDAHLDGNDDARESEGD